MVFSLEHDIKVTKSHQNLLPTQSVIVAHTGLYLMYTCDRALPRQGVTSRHWVSLPLNILYVYILNSISLENKIQKKCMANFI
jgi:hypothetical protein